MFSTIARFKWGDYIAISYMWGSPDDTRIITINGMPVIVGKDLAAALDFLGSSIVDRVWIDAVRMYVDRYRRTDHENRGLNPYFLRDSFLANLISSHRRRQAQWHGEF